MSKHIALIAHDNRKSALVSWLKQHRDNIVPHRLYATGTTGTLIERELGCDVQCFQSGPLGGDQQIGSLIAEGRIDLLLFFWDPMAAQPHDPDIKALLRLAVVWNVPVACSEATADFLITSPLFNSDYQRMIPDFTAYKKRKV